jgi:chaperone modulatory protein CbpM
MQEEDFILTAEFCKFYQVDSSFLHSLEEYGLIEFKVFNNSQFIHKDALHELEKYIRLHYDLSINMEGLDAIHHLLQRLNEMQLELTALRNRLSFYE